MYKLRITTLIAASPAVCFDLARSMRAVRDDASVGRGTYITVGETLKGGTLMIIRGTIRSVAERLFLGGHLRRFLVKRGIALKQLAERGPDAAAE